MKTFATILQIVPRPPGGQGDGVGDYAAALARGLFDLSGSETVFASGTAFGAVPCDHIILHYVNYGFQKRGVPIQLLSSVRELRRSCPGKLLTIFHELYASGPFWKSAFWLRPMQIYIARSIARLSDACIVSSPALREQLRELAPDVAVSICPVSSNFGEPAFASEQIANRDSHRWTICGGTALIERSLRSLRAIVNRIPSAFYPDELFVLGGNDDPTVRSLIVDLVKVRVEYRPQIAAEDISQILSTCSFAWFDYFHCPGVPSDAILKSSAFGAACAHGVIAVFSHGGSPIAIDGDPLPGPWFIDAHSIELPPEAAREVIASKIHRWYHRHASAEIRARIIAGALGIGGAKAHAL